MRYGLKGKAKTGKNLAEMGSNFFGGLNQKSDSITFSWIKSSNSCKKNHGQILIVTEFIRRLVMETLEKNRIEILPFMWLFGGLTGNFVSDWLLIWFAY